MDIPDDISNDPLKYEAFLRAKYDEQQWEAAHSGGGGGSGGGSARPARGGLLGKVGRPKLPSFKGGSKVEHAPRLVDSAGTSSGSADNTLLSILDAEIKL